MKENELIVAGYSFVDAMDYKEAKREAETVDYIRANTDLNDLNKTLKLYHKLVERKTLKTIVGYAFLKELQDRIIKEGIVGKENLPCIQIEKNEIQARTFSNKLKNEQEQKQLDLINDYKIRLRNSRIISAFLIAIIIVMIGIAIWSDRTKFYIHENNIIDKYSSWEEELETRQKQLNEREKLQSVE